MTRLPALLRALVCAAILALAAAHSALAARPQQTIPGPHHGQGHAAGTVVALGWSSFTLRIGGHRMSVVRALTAAANAVAHGDYPYVYGGGHAQAGAGSIAELRRQNLIVGGVGHGAGAVTFWDKPGVHIFMSINGRVFGTSDGGPGNPGQPHGGAGWLNDGAPDALNRAFKPYHLVATALGTTTVYGPTLTFSTGRAYDLLEGVALGDELRVSYTRDRKGALTAGEVAFADARTVTATITAVASDRSSVTVQTPGGSTLTPATADPRLLDWVGVGDEVSVTYTPGADGSPVARQMTAVSPPST